ncbi:putative flavin-adenine dinucleotide transporter [Dioszegia hungarica]|uniref:Flavin-adenine dinucleotide transporter n=1 Tax=Dioszegia hungarica TaxID=4972 RepID=A0AA38H5F2_9TREE|nr:putative flavin-adenine dinucleotide transporter [Dioszegia hungarica]KAI9634390.1 putative flavin-adenine dinucleotide transporter [Dioszegia hungarica]
MSVSQPLSVTPSLFGDPSIDHAVAGFTAGTVATLIMHPLDLIKVRFQLAGNTLASSSMTSKRPGFGRAVYGALEDAVRADGWKGLYRGLSPNLVGSASSWGLYFLFYNTIKKQMQQRDPNNRTSGGQHLLAAAEASAAVAMLTNPIWVVKTRVFGTARTDSTAYKGLWDGLTGIYRTEGMRGLYKGSLLALVGVSNGSIQFATYEDLKRRRTEAKRRKFQKSEKEFRIQDEKLSNLEYILTSGASKTVAIALTYPYQVVRARIQNASPSPSQPRVTIPSVIAATYRNEGFLAFYKGLGTNALRILPGTAVLFCIYENLVWGFRAYGS